MRIISVNVGLPREVEWRGKIVRTSIFKEPVSGSVQVRTLNLDGDQQSDLTVHGGVNMAVYAYPSEHYSYWQSELPETELPWGAFGENLTTEGLLEDRLNIGDRFRIGSAEFVVTQPRIPCYKLGIRLGRDDIVKRFLQSGRTGFYLAVTQEGQISAGDAIERLSVNEQHVTVPDILNLYVAKAPGRELLEKVSNLPELPAGWRDHFRKRLLALGG
ncbi:MAG TPA: MOSC domain-containing protein [Blastocatellia bacterium]|nr:MOSC domain-containing protein [Blastocatellia bacterium]